MIAIRPRQRNIANLDGSIIAERLADLCFADDIINEGQILATPKVNLVVYIHGQVIYVAS